MNRRTRYISQVNNIICVFGKLDCVTKVRLFKEYCSNFYGSELWDLANDSMETLDKTWRNALRRIFNLPNTFH